MTNANATPSPLPVHIKPHQETDNTTTNNNKIVNPKPKLRLHLQDARHNATASFFRFIPDIQAVLDAGLTAIIEHLYTPPSSSSKTSFKPEIPATRSVTVILQDFSGVAYTNGTDLDNDHKEIHFSLSYINQVCHHNADALSELKGVLTHELVHCYQHTSPPPNTSTKDQVPNPPGGLIEGIADFVRLKAGYVPPHWQKPKSAGDRPSKWDEGYQHTAFFLEWLEDVRVGRGAIGLLNDRLLRVGYVGEHEGSGFWKGLFGAGVSQLWEEYGEYLDKNTS